MKRVKIFMEQSSYDRLEEQVNDFLATLMPEKVLDIQYRDCDHYVSVMVVYEDEPAIAAITPASDPFNVKPRTFEEIYGGSQ